jgi:hypothetical protein
MVEQIEHRHRNYRGIALAQLVAPLRASIDAIRIYALRLRA